MNADSDGEVEESPLPLEVPDEGNASEDFGDRQPEEYSWRMAKTETFDGSDEYLDEYEGWMDGDGCDLNDLFGQDPDETQD